MPAIGHGKSYHVIGYRVSRLSNENVCVTWALRMRRKPFWIQHKDNIMHIMQLQGYLDARPLPTIEERRSVAWGWMG